MDHVSNRLETPDRSFSGSLTRVTGGYSNLEQTGLDNKDI
jgi:hypothetical protein